MKKWIWLLIPLLLLLGRMEHTGLDIRRLDPVKLIRVTAEENSVRIETDTGTVGIGMDIADAVADLRASSPKTVFLDTAQYLLLSGEAVEYLPRLSDLLRPICQVCLAQGELDLAEAASYLDNHSPECRLLDCRAGGYKLQTFYYIEGRGQLVPGTD